MTPPVAGPRIGPDHPTTRGRSHWSSAAAASALIHVACLGVGLILARRGLPAEGSGTPGVEMVFAQPPAAHSLQPIAQAPAQPEPAASPPPQQSAGPEPSGPEPSTDGAPEPADPTPLAQPEPTGDTLASIPQPALPEPPPPPPSPPPQKGPARVESPRRDAQAKPRPVMQPPPPGRTPPAPVGSVSPPASASTAASASAAPTTVQAPPTAAWRQALAAWLLAHKTYPDAARQRDIEGTVGVRFTLDRAGRVIELAVIRSSGSSILDAGAEAMLRNAALPPPEPPQDRTTVTVQVHYSLDDD